MMAIRVRGGRQRATTVAFALAGLAAGVSTTSSTATATTSIKPNTELVGPTGSGEFGQHVTVLANGNYLVLDPSFDNGAVADVGAVYLYNGLTNTVISTLTGSTSGDKVGASGMVILDTNATTASNVLILSPNWHNGAVANAGAVTWLNGTTGLSGTVSAANSLVGATNDDFVGMSAYEPYALINGNYVVRTPSWDNGAALNAGAVTWGNGTTGSSGVVSTANSLVGSTTNDEVGSTVNDLISGNYVVSSPSWDNGATADVGAVTWVNGTTGLVGTVSAANSLVGTTASDMVGTTNVALTNGNLVTASHWWDNGATTNVGAATWINGATGRVGTVSLANSMIGGSANDFVGGGVEPLTNGNYLLASSSWHSGSIANVGAITWGNGTTGTTTGTVSSSNSIVGSSAFDAVGAWSPITLSNGNFVVRDPYWDNGAIAEAGAVVWGNGTVGTSGVISAANALVGSSADDKVGSSVTVLTGNSNYVVPVPDWDNGALSNVGAVVWGNGAIGTSGVISAANSLTGSAANDQVGNYGVAALTNGNYVVRSSSKNNGLVTQAGAITWGKGSTGSVGVVSGANSLVGLSASDHIGEAGVVALSNGNYAVLSPGWDDGTVVDVGAVTWATGTAATAAFVTSLNSVIGSTTGDKVGDNGSKALTNGNLVFRSLKWDNGTAVDAGAVTWMSGVAASVGAVSASNSVFGTGSANNVGSGGLKALNDGNYLVLSPNWDNGAVTNVGAVTWGNGTNGTGGAISAANSLIGSTSGDVVSSNDNGDLSLFSDGSYLVVSSAWDNGATANAGAATYGAAGGTVGVLSTTNSAVGTPSGAVSSPAESATSGHYLPVMTTQNRVLLVGLPYTPVVTPPVDPPVDPPVSPPAVSPPAVKPDYQALSPARLADTRSANATVDGLFSGGGRRAAGSTLELTVAGRGGVAADASAVGLNLTAVNPAAAGFATVFPCGSTPPNASNLNWSASAGALANAVITKIGVGGKVCIFVSAATQILVDVNGAFPADTTLVTLNPARLLDTRLGGVTVDGVGAGAGVRPAGSTTSLQVTGRAGVPATATTVVLNVTATGTVAPGYLTVYACGGALPGTSSLNFGGGQTVANLVISKLAADGTVCVRAQAGTHLIVDVSGYVPTTTTLHSLDPIRILDTRPGSGTVDGLAQGADRRPAGSVTELTVTGRTGGPAAASAVVLNVTAVAPSGGGYLTVYPCGITRPEASNLNFAANSGAIANAVITTVGTSGNVCIYTSTATQLLADLSAYVTATS
jgi:trimeric autotransporter adhesin